MRQDLTLAKRTRWASQKAGHNSQFRQCVSDAQRYLAPLSLCEGSIKHSRLFPLLPFLLFSYSRCRLFRTALRLFNIPSIVHHRSNYFAVVDCATTLANMASFLESSYSLVHQDNAADVPTMSELRTQLEKGTDESKVETMKRILTVMLNGDPMPQLLMHIIRFVMPSKHKALKKLLYFYYEICPKLDASGKLKQEMILVW